MADPEANSNAAVPDSEPLQQPPPAVPNGANVHVVDKIDIDDELDWLETPTVSFGSKATFQVASWLLIIFAGVYVLSFVMGFGMFFMSDKERFDGMLELVKFLLGTIIPLVTLAVGYYLGDKNSSSDQ